MKTTIKFYLFLLLPFIATSQLVKDADFIAPLEEGYAAVKANDQWSFMDEEGKLIMDFRSDLISNKQVTTEVDLGVASQLYPVLVEDRAIIKKQKDGIDYYGFINSEGTTVIEAQFLNVSNFKDGFALALAVSEDVLGENKALGKRLVSYSYDVVLIDSEGAIVKYLCGPFSLSLSKDKLKQAPPIVVKDLSENLIAVKTTKGKWEVVKIE